MHGRLALALLFVTGCDAGFVDLRDGVAASPGTPASRDAGRPRNGEGLDGGAPSSGEAAVVAAGPWAGRADYRASGTAELVMRGDGAFELRLSEDFSVSRVPGPVVVLSRRDRLGSGIRPEEGDVELGPQAEPSGAQTYAVPAGADDRRVVWIYCKPFGLEVGRAVLSDR